MARTVKDSHQESSAHRRWTGLEKFLAVAAAAFTLATAVLTLITTEVNSDRQQAGSDLATLQSQYNALSGRNSRLETQNQQYRAQLAKQNSTTSPAPRTQQSSAGGGTELGSYQFDLVGGHEVPLGAHAPSQAQLLAGDQGDITWRSDLGGEPLVPGANEPAVLLDTGSVPGYQACKTGQRIESSVSQLVVGTAFCIIENTAVVAGVRVVAINTSTSPAYLTLAVTTWRNSSS